MRRVAIGAAALVLILVVALLALHAPPVRRAVLRYAVGTLEEQYRLRIDAGSLDYNLATLSLSLSGLRVAANHTPDMPFFEADRVAVQVARSTFGGPVAFDDIAVTSGRLRIVRTTSGTNLPLLDDAGAGEPEPLRIAHLSAPGFAVTVQDEVAGLSVEVPAIDLELAADEGHVALQRAATIGYAGRSTEVTTLAGDVTFDGRTLGFANLQAASPEATLAVDGTVGLIAAEPQLQVQVSGRGDLARLAAWASLEGERPQGAVDFAGSIAGPLDTPVADVTLRSDAVQWQGLNIVAIGARARVTSDAIDIADAQLGIAGGTAQGRAHLEFAEAGTSEVTLDWRDVDVETLVVPFAGSGNPLPTGTTSGDLDLRTVGPSDPRTSGVRWVGGARVALSAGRNTPGRFSAPGETQLRLVEGRWQLDGAHTIADVIPAAMRLRGTLPDDGLTASPVDGVVSIAPVPPADLIAVLRTLDLAAVPPDIVVEGGTVAAEIGVSGLVRSPRLSIDATLTETAAGVERGSARINGTFTARGPADALRGMGRFDVAEARWDDVALGDAMLGVELTPTNAQLTATVPAFNATANGNIALQAPYQAVIDLAASDLDVSPLTALLPQASTVTGRVDVTAHGEGPLEDWRAGAAQAEIARVDLMAGALPVRLDGPARLSYERERVVIEQATVLAGEARISATGALPLTGAGAADAIAITARGDAGDIAQAAELSGLVDLPIVGGAGPVQLEARVGGSLASPQLSGDLDLGPAAMAIEDLPLVTGIRVRAALRDDTITVAEAAAAFQGAQARATGTIPASWFSGASPGPSPANARLTGRIENIGPGVLEPFLDPATLAELAGTLDLSVDVSSPSAQLEQLSGSVTLDRFDVRLSDLPLTQRVPTRIDLGNGFARIAAWDWAGQGMTMAVAGQVRLADLQAGIIATGDLDARMLTPFIRPAGLSASGRLAPRLSITGPLASPRVDGDLTLTGAEVRLVDPRVVVSGLNGRAVLTRTTANLTNVTGTINGGSLALSGEAEFVPREAVQAALTAAIRGMGIEVPDGLRSEVDADLRLSLNQTLDADINTLSGELGGTITVLRGSYREPLAVLGALMSGAQAPAANLAPVAGSPLLDNLALDLRLVTSDDIIVNNNTARLAAGADLRINGTAAVPAVGGRIDLREGGRIFLGRNVYEIVSGSVDFTDPAAIRPELDVQLTTRAGGQPIDVALSGRADAPDVLLSSTNPELTQADLTALLVTGRQFDELASADAALIGSTVIGNLSGDVLGFAGRAVGLDTLRLGGVDADTARRDPTAAASEVDPTSRLTFGKSIGGNVDVTFSQSLREGDAQTWIVDYLPSRRLLLRLVSNDEDLRAYSFRHDVAVGAPQLARPPVVARAAELRVAAVTLGGTLAVPEEELRDLLQLEAGDRFDFAEWQDDRERLERFYRSSNRLAARIDASRSDAGDGVALAYTIEAGPETRIDVSGTALSEGTLEQLRDAWTLAIVDDLLVDEARQVVSDALSADGYLRPQVSAGLTDEGGVRTLEIVTVPGIRTTDVRVQLSGVDAALEADLMAWADVDRRMQAVRSPGAFETAVLTYLQDLGYLGAQVQVGAPRLEGSGAEVPVSIATGRQLVVSAIRFEGATLPDDQLRAAVALDAGVPLGPGRIEEARQQLVTLYRREGFPSTEVTARPSPEAVVFEVEEGPRQSIADIAVNGSARVDADVVSRALMLAPGTPLRAEDLLAARGRLFDTGLFRRVDVVTEPIEAGAAGAGAGTVPMRVRVTLEEWPALRLRYGVEVVEERAEDALTGRNLVPGLSADLTRRTLFGRPVGFGVALDYRNRDRSARTFLSAPTFLGRSIETALTLEWTRSVNPSETVDNRRSLSLEQRIRRRSLQLSYGYRFERSRTDLPPDPLIGPLPPFIITVGRLTSSLAADTRDDPVQPLRGTFVAVSLEYAPQVGSDFEFARYSAQAYRFTPWRDVVFASAARFGAVHAFGGQEVIPSERFFAGGARSVRGVAEEGLGERDFFGDPVGGEALLLLNQEVRFPIYRWLRGVGFVDAGNVFAAPSAIRLGDLTVSAGAGLRLVTPFAILRADVGRVLETGGHRWTFGIGHAF